MSKRKGASNNKMSAWNRIKKVVLFVSFSDPKLEKQFLKKQISDNLSFNRAVTFCGFVTYTGFFLMNYFLMPPDNSMLYWGPYGAAFVAVATIFIVSYLDVPHYIFNICAAASLLVATASPLVTLTSYRYPDTYYFHSGCVLLLIASLVFIRISFYFTVLFSILYLASFELMYGLMGPHSLKETLNIHYILLTAIVVSLIINYFIEKRERTNFVKLRIIIEDRMKLSRLRDAVPGPNRKAR